MFQGFFGIYLWLEHSNVPITHITNNIPTINQQYLRYFSAHSIFSSFHVISFSRCKSLSDLGAACGLEFQAWFKRRASHERHGV